MRLMALTSCGVTLATLVALCCSGIASAAKPAEAPVRVAAAGSLSGALTSIIRAYHKATGFDVHARFGPAGLLAKRIADGASTEVFLSANLTYPRKLARQGRATTPVVVTRNHLCVTTLPGFGLTQTNFLERLLDPGVKIGTSTPGADPGGDYAQLLFAKVAQARPGARGILGKKSRALVGGRMQPKQPAGQVIADAFSHGTIQMFIGYCSRHQVHASSHYSRVRVPARFSVPVNYGVTVILHNGRARTAAYRFALFTLSPHAQAILADYGFEPVARVQ